MDKDLVQQVKKSSKKTAKKNKVFSKKKLALLNPVKVVYISSPMKIKTSASNFRALVQELTGRDSDFPPNPTKFNEEEDESFSTAQIEGGASDGLQVASSESVTCSSPSNATNNIDHDDGKKNGFELFDDQDDDVFMPQMMEGFPGIFPSALWYESPYQAV